MKIQIGGIMEETEFKELFFKAFRNDREKLKKWLEIQTAPLTTKELCEATKININSWYKSNVRNLPEVVALRDRVTNKSIIYKPEAVEVVARLWKEDKLRKGERTA